MSHDNPPRRFPKCMPTDWTPPVPAWSAALPSDGQLIVAYYGVQSSLGADVDEVFEFRSWLAGSLEQSAEGVHCEYAEYVDAQGYYTWLCIGYWSNKTDYERWLASHAYQQYWISDARLSSRVGVFQETLVFASERFETLRSDSQERVGASRVCPVLHGPIREHNYWGGTRDRIAASAYDLLAAGSGKLVSDAAEGGTLGRRVCVQIPDNLAVIRSGQAFGDLEGLEKDIYFGEIEPALRAGMDYLRDYPAQTHCFSCRLLCETDASGNPLSRTFGLAHFASLKHLEDWARSHPTHLRIFDGFIAMATELGGNLKLRLWHEVAVLSQQNQRFEYTNCHSSTGLLAQAESSLVSNSKKPGAQA